MLRSLAAILVEESQKGFREEDDIRELRQPRRRRQQIYTFNKRNDTFARFARAFFMLKKIADVLVLPAT